MPGFPTTLILDDFNRADENPLSQGGLWTTLGEMAAPQVVSNQLKIVGGGSESSYRNVQIESPESYLTCATVPLTGVFLMYLRLRDNGGASPIRLSRMDGYRVVFEANTGFFILREDNAVSTTILASTAWTGGNIANGDSVGCRMAGSRIEVWVKRGSGAWTFNRATYDTVHTLPGAIGFFIQAVASNPAYDNFGGGTVTESVSRPDFTTFPKPKLRTPV